MKDVMGRSGAATSKYCCGRESRAERLATPARVAARRGAHARFAIAYFCAASAYPSSSTSRPSLSKLASRNRNELQQHWNEPCGAAGTPLDEPCSRTLRPSKLLHWQVMYYGWSLSQPNSLSARYVARKAHTAASLGGTTTTKPSYASARCANGEMPTHPGHVIVSHRIQSHAPATAESYHGVIFAFLHRSTTGMNLHSVILVSTKRIARE